MNTPIPILTLRKLDWTPNRKGRHMMVWLSVTEQIVGRPGPFNININMENHPGKAYKICLDLVTIGKEPEITLSGITINGEDWPIMTNWKPSRYAPHNVYPLVQKQIMCDSKITLKLGNPNPNPVTLPSIFFMGHMGLND